MAGRTRLTEQQREEIIEKYSTGNFSHRKLGDEYGVSYNTIARLVNPEYAARVVNNNRHRMREFRKNNNVDYYIIHVECHPEDDADIIEKLNAVGSKKDYVQNLIREDIASETKQKQ